MYTPQQGGMYDSTRVALLQMPDQVSGMADLWEGMAIDGAQSAPAMKGCAERRPFEFPKDQSRLRPAAVVAKGRPTRMDFQAVSCTTRAVWHDEPSLRMLHWHLCGLRC